MDEQLLDVVVVIGAVHRADDPERTPYTQTMVLKFDVESRNLKAWIDHVKAFSVEASQPTGWKGF